MNQSINADEFRSAFLEKNVQSRLLEMYFLVTDEEIGNLVWKIAAMTDDERQTVSALINVIRSKTLAQTRN